MNNLLDTVRPGESSPGASLLPSVQMLMSAQRTLMTVTKVAQTLMALSNVSVKTASGFALMAVAVKVHMHMMLW